jgi:hypothetical protein
MKGLLKFLPGKASHFARPKKNKIGFKKWDMIAFSGHLIRINQHTLEGPPRKSVPTLFYMLRPLTRIFLTS